jgi:hypothetical protein
MAKPKGDFGLAIMLSGKPKKKAPSHDMEEDDYDDEAPVSEREEDSSSSDRYTALYEEMKDCEDEGDTEGAAKALKTFVKLCMS